MINYEFECNMDAEECKQKQYGSCDDWCAALMWANDGVGAEYNFCYQNGENYCAIYPMILSEYGDWDTDTQKYLHYEIDFMDLDWKKKLEVVMHNAVQMFFSERVFD